MTCKDCVHYECCQWLADVLRKHGFGVEFDDNISVEKTCDHFKNKADFVKIPCRCKDCDHFNNYNPDRTYCEEHSDGWGDSIVYVDEDDYCSFGIRKKEGADNG